MLKRAVIFANGVLYDAGKIKEQIVSSDFLLAVDGGHHHMKSLGLIPDLVIGDLDSIQKAEFDQLHNSGVEILQFPSEIEGGHVRVGLEDASFGTERTNLELVTDAAERIRNMGSSLATAKDIRAALAPEE